MKLAWQVLFHLETKKLKLHLQGYKVREVVQLETEPWSSDSYPELIPYTKLSCGCSE